MAIEVRIPKEIMEYQAKIMGGLTGRQLVSSAVAIISMFVIYPISINLFGVELWTNGSFNSNLTHLVQLDFIKKRE